MKKPYLFFIFLFKTCIVHGSYETIEFPYYTHENLTKINAYNHKIMELHAEKEDIKKINLRKKHIPLIIFFDPENAETAIKKRTPTHTSIQLKLIALAEADFTPPILLNESILTNLLHNITHKESRLLSFKIEQLEQTYSIYKVLDTQLILLIPHWFKEHYSLKEYFSNITQISLHEIDTKQPSKVDIKNNIKNILNHFTRTFNLKKTDAIFDFYFLGHGGLSKKIVGIHKKILLEMLTFLKNHIRTGVVNIASCYAGGQKIHWLNKRLDSLPFHMIVSSIGETVTISPPYKSQYQKSFTQLIKYFFNDAAYLEYNTTLETTSFLHLIDSFLEFCFIRQGSIHQSEYLPCFKLKESSVIDVPRNTPGFFIIDRHNAHKELRIPPNTHTIVLLTSNINKIIISPTSFKTEHAYKDIEKRMKKLYPGQKKRASQIIPTFIPLISNKEIITFESIEIEQNEFKCGLYSLLTTFFSNDIIYQKIKIKNLSGPFDLEQSIIPIKESFDICKTVEELYTENEEQLKEDDEKLHYLESLYIEEADNLFNTLKTNIDIPHDMASIKNVCIEAEDPDDDDISINGSLSITFDTTQDTTVKSYDTIFPAPHYGATLESIFSQDISMFSQPLWNFKL